MEERGVNSLVGEYESVCGGLLVVTSKTLSHLTAHPEVTRELLTDSISRVGFPKNGTKKLVTEIDLGRVIGKGNLIPAPKIEPNAIAKFAYRKGRRTASRVVENIGTDPPDITTLTIFAHEGEDDPVTGKRRFYLRTCYVGKVVQREPGDSVLRSGSKEEGQALAFWCEHALIHDTELMGPVFESTWRDIVSEKRTKPQQKRKTKKSGVDDDEDQGSDEDELEDQLQQQKVTDSDMLGEPNIKLGDTELYVTDFEDKATFIIQHVKGWEEVVKSEIWEKTDALENSKAFAEGTRRGKKLLKRDNKIAHSVQIRKKKGYHDMLILTVPEEKVDDLWGLTTFESFKICVAIVAGIFPDNISYGEKDKTSNKNNMSTNTRESINSDTITTTTTATQNTSTTSTTNINTTTNGSYNIDNIDATFNDLPFLIPEQLWTNAISAWRRFQMWKASQNPDGKCLCVKSDTADTQCSLPQSSFSKSSSLPAQPLQSPRVSSSSQHSNSPHSNLSCCPVCGSRIAFRVTVAKGSNKSLGANFASGVAKLLGWEPTLQGFVIEHKRFLFINFNLEFLRELSAKADTNALKHERILHSGIVYGLLRLTHPLSHSVLFDPYFVDNGIILDIAHKHDTSLQLIAGDNGRGEDNTSRYKFVGRENDIFALKDGSVDVIITKIPKDYPNPAWLRNQMHEFTRLIKKGGQGRIALVSQERRVVFQEISQSHWNLIWNHKLQVDGLDVTVFVYCIP